ncbi:MAG: flagellar FlbD family protein [Candidatus Delongbacteria bacterium]|nr:flagellar FlbD family protein [Candidatus Delongbacteria bacterium]
MILLKKINGQEIVLNAELIEMIEETPDTIISLVNGKKIVVIDSKEVIIQKVMAYKQTINRCIPGAGGE